METKDRTALKSYFVKNAIPTESNFADLIDGMINQREDGLEKRAGEPLRVQADSGPMQKVLSFYRNFAESKPAWTVSLNPRVDLDKPDTARPGWGVGDGEGRCRLFIDEKTGNIGVGTVDPGEAKLAVAGGFRATSNFSGERALGMEVPQNANHRGDGGAQNATGLVYRVLANPGDGDPIFQVTSQGHAVRFFVEHNGWTGSRDNSAWFGGGRSNYFKGKVGIGTEDPKADLDVNGNAMVNNVFLGDVGHGPTWAGFCHKGSVSQVGYGFLHHNSGQYALINKKSGPGYIALRIDNGNRMVLQDNGNVGIGTDNPAAKLQVVGSVMEQMGVIRTGSRGDWGSGNHPIMQYFKTHLGGKPVGTYMKAIQDHPSWRGHYWQGWVDVDGRVRVIHNYYNTPHVI